jgi:hypothetical protein
VAVALISNAILEIRRCAASGTEHLRRIHQLADVVHGLPIGVLSGAGPGRYGEGYRTFRLMWERASEDQRAWLVAQFEALSYDYSYLEEPADPPLPRSSHWSTKAKRVDAVTLLRLDPSVAFEIDHAEPGAVHTLVPQDRDELLFGSPGTGTSEFDALVRMGDGETIVLHLRFEAAAFESLRTRRRLFRWTPPDRDGYLWRRGHEPSSCAICAARES